MGITRGTARLLLEEAKRRPFSGAVLELGKMSVFFDEAELRHWAGLHGVDLAPDVEILPSHDPVLAVHGCMDDTSFFRLLGFDRVISLDAAAWEGAAVVADLNLPLPEDLQGGFDLVFEGGTLESIYDVPQVMTNIHAALCPEGRVVHAMTPSTNHVDLGFYMFSPTYFTDFYGANGWTLNSMLLCEHELYWVAGKLESGPWDVYNYEPGCLDHLSLGRYGGRQLTVFAVATRHAEATAGVAPQQLYYRQLWREDRESRRRGQEAKARRVRKLRWLYRTRVYGAYKRITERLRRGLLPRGMPPRVARL